MESGSILGLGAITLIVIGFVVFLGVRLNKAVVKRTPDNVSSPRITLTGTVVYAFMVGFWLICVVAARLQGESWFGSFVGSADGVAAVIIFSLVAIVVAEVILEKLGYPLFNKDKLR